MTYKIALIFTEGVSLRTWARSGLVVRDSLLYEQLCELGHEVTFVTYGKPDDGKHLPEGSRIRVLSRPARMSHRTYGRLLPFVHFNALRQVDLVKGHQLKGARYAAWTARLLRKPLIARCGYLPAVFLESSGASQEEIGKAHREARRAFRTAGAAFVPGETEATYIREHYAVPRSRIHQMPNWIDTARFAPSPAPASERFRVAFVGRFSSQKQPLMLIEAMRGLPEAELLMIGGGELEDEIHEKITAAGIKATVLGRTPNEELPDLLRTCSVYVLPTLYEGGSPKTLLEAMACGLPVISTNAFGVDDAFADGVHGIKIDCADTGGLRSSLQWIRDHADEARAMGARGRAHVIEHYSIDESVRRELEVYEQLTSGARGPSPAP